jgi:hypothetical protein
MRHRNCTNVCRRIWQREENKTGKKSMRYKSVTEYRMLM